MCSSDLIPVNFNVRVFEYVVISKRKIGRHQYLTRYLFLDSRKNHLGTVRSEALFPPILFAQPLQCDLIRQPLFSNADLLVPSIHALQMQSFAQNLPRLATSDQLTSQGESSTEQMFSFVGLEWFPPKGLHWKTTIEGLVRTAKAERVMQEGASVRYVRCLDDFAATPRTNIWLDIGGVQSRTDPKIYVVQTATEAVQRCILMATDPGDLVLDPTCGSGTTAYVSEQWGRRNNRLFFAYAGRKE